MALDATDAKVKSTFTGIGKAVVEFLVALMEYVAQLRPAEREYAEELLMPLLRISKEKASRLLAKASDLTARPVVLQALAEGRVDEGKALMIVELLQPLSAVQAATAEQVLLAHAENNAYSATRQYARRYIDRLDPTAAEHRHQEKREQRKVEKTNLDDGMASLRLIMPALDTALAFDHIDAIARGLPKDGRALDQKRVDVALDLLLGKETGAPQGQVTVNLTMAISSLIGMDDDPAILQGHGPLPIKIARDVAAGGIWKRILTDPVTGIAEDVTTYRPTTKQRELIAARYPHCTMIGCRQPVHRCDLDHCCPFNGSNTSVDNLRPKCRRHHRMKHETSWQCHNLEDGRHVWTTPEGKTYESEIEPIGEPAPF
ncbi:HNH endonuclease [Allokutzneria sp. A3M-2-11 16]|uniref:HNH endonuclease signature motif containing protein n=1 Tax=Allokutzneria sp. A3M-2-11 16 TaxID=2962043 RepID=UPI0020B8ACAE|nr:HNH endonuclease signature motif containing protein [Allokutzneria sp. A3M-2-11 16]MCP3802186.1 HNH endonuclease [Allokutzneria sp. A3M-2-11 16]